MGDGVAVVCVSLPDLEITVNVRILPPAPLPLTTDAAACREDSSSFD